MQWFPAYSFRSLDDLFYPVRVCFSQLLFAPTVEAVTGGRQSRPQEVPQEILAETLHHGSFMMRKAASGCERGDPVTFITPQY